MWTLISVGWKAITGFGAMYKFWIYGAVIVGFLGTALYYVSNYYGMKAELPLLNEKIVSLEAEADSFRHRMIEVNARLRVCNNDKTAAVDAAKARMDAMREEAALVGAKNAALSEEMEMLRFTNLELVRDDEEVQDWLDCADIPGSILLQLHNAKEAAKLD